jgi:hypothetical protein
MSRAVRIGRRAVRSSRPLMAQVRRFTASARPLGSLFSTLFTNLRDRGMVENSLKFIYYAAAAAARFDRVSHILPAHIVGNECNVYSTSPVAGCSARYADSTTSERATPARKRRRAPRQDAPARAPQPAAPAPAAPNAPGPARPAPLPKPQLPPVPKVEDLVDQVMQQITRPNDNNGQALEDLAGYLLR